ncbi:MAG TPA: HAD family hydrolase [Nitrolancea sp.]|nr:HAD family hydrolase [Nitrolancea sp.]
MSRAVTIDFHDTLFLCDDWFMLEVRDLPARFLDWQSARSGVPISSDLRQRITFEYRELRRAIIESGIEVDATENVMHVCERVGLTPNRLDVAIAVDELMAETLASAAPRPGAIELVRTLKSAGIPVGIVSNAIHQSFLEWAVAASGMGDLFDSVLTSARSGYYKSRPEIYWQAARELGVAPEDTIHIGDSPRFDVIGAAHAGMRTVWLDLSHEPIGDGLPDLTVLHLDGLAPLMFGSFEFGPIPTRH